MVAVAAMALPLMPWMMRPSRDGNSLRERTWQLALEQLRQPYVRLTGDQQRMLILQAMSDPRTRMPDPRPGRYVASWDGPAVRARRLAS